MQSIMSMQYTAGESWPQAWCGIFTDATFGRCGKMRTQRVDSKTWESTAERAHAQVHDSTMQHH